MVRFLPTRDLALVAVVGVVLELAFAMRSGNAFAGVLPAIAVVFGCAVLERSTPDGKPTPVVVQAAALLAVVGWPVVAHVEPAEGLRFGLALMAGCGIVAATSRSWRGGAVLARHRWTLSIAAGAIWLAPLVFRLPSALQGGAYISVPVGPLALTTGDAARLAAVLAMAGHLATLANPGLVARRLFGLPVPHPRAYVPVVLVAVGGVVLLAASRDIGSVLLLSIVTTTLLGAVTGRLFWPVAGLACMGIAFTASLFAFDHVSSRVDRWLSLGTNRQPVVEDLLHFSAAAGGATGVGVGNGWISPLGDRGVAEDLAFGVVLQELGWLGGTAVLVTVGALVTGGIAAAITAPTGFERVVALGVATSVGWQACLISGGVVGLLPITGLPFPFLGAGTTHVIVTSVAVGMLAGIQQRGVPARLTKDSVHARTVLVRAGAT